MNSMRQIFVKESEKIYSESNRSRL